MPIEPRRLDDFTRGNLFKGLPIVTFTPRDPATQALLAPIEIGTVAEAAYQREIETGRLPNNESGITVITRELVTRLEPTMRVATFNFRADIAELIFGSDTAVAIVANPAEAITDEPLQILTGADADRTFINLVNADVDDTPANLTLTAAPIVDELVGTGDGVLGTTDGDFTLGFKPLILADITRLQEINPTTGAVVRTFVPQAGEPLSEFEAQVAVGLGATSGEIDLFQAIGSGNQLRADYAPSHTYEEDVNAASPDMILDPLLGKIRFPNIDSAAAPDGTSGLRQGQNVLLDYQYNRKAGVSFRPYVQPSREGVCEILHAPDIGINFRHDIPSCTIRLTDDDLEFNQDPFSTAILQLIIEDAGGTARFGTITSYASEAQAAA